MNELQQILQGPKGITPAQARLMHYFKSQDTFFNFALWPPWAQASAISYKDNRARYRLCCFFAFNGLPPKLLDAWVLAGDTVNIAGVVHLQDAKVYSPKARGQVQELRNLYNSGAFFEYPRLPMSVMDMTAGHVIYLDKEGRRSTKEDFRM